MTNKPKMHHCFNCGEELGVYASQSCFNELEDCGKLECTRAARDCYQAEREEAHEQLDRDMGW
jgi:hypothetical protein